MKMDKVLETLKEDYSLRASLKRKHLKVQDELEDEIDDLEQSLITSKIIPELKQYAIAMLKDLECEVYLTVKKDTNGNIEICDDSGCIIAPPKQFVPTQQVAPTVQTTTSSSAILITPQNIQDVKGRDMRITVNGRVFQENNAIQTFIEALKFIGLDEVAKVGIVCAGYNLVDSRQRLDGGKRWQQQEGNKWVYVYFSNETKVNYLMQIADTLKVKIKIEAI